MGFKAQAGQLNWAVVGTNIELHDASTSSSEEQLTSNADASILKPSRKKSRSRSGRSRRSRTRGARHGDQTRGRTRKVDDDGDCCDYGSSCNSDCHYGIEYNEACLRKDVEESGYACKKQNTKVVDCKNAEAQAPRDVSDGYRGDFQAKVQPQPAVAVDGFEHVNLHFHLGAEHRSSGEYDT